MGDYVYVDEGSLPPPGPIGRLTRLLLGVACLYLVTNVIDLSWWRIDTVYLSQGSLWPYILFAVFLFPEVFNLGFSLSLSRRGLRAWAVVVGLVMALGSKLITGSFFGTPFGVFAYFWLLYVYSHLGISMILSAVIRTPGCEMRAIPHLWTKISGRSTKEHFCPGMLNPLDRWERGRSSSSGAGGPLD